MWLIALHLDFVVKQYLRASTLKTVKCFTILSRFRISFLSGTTPVPLDLCSQNIVTRCGYCWNRNLEICCLLTVLPKRNEGQKRHFLSHFLSDRNFEMS